jgi:DNA-binding NarL/FixJ family response regulator
MGVSHSDIDHLECLSAVWSGLMHPIPTTTTVLLVDDRPLVRDAIRSVLQGCEDVQVVGEANDGVEAVQYARMLKPYVVLMDINMPQMNGVEATRTIKQEDPDTIIIGLSIEEDGTIPQALLRAGATTYLPKDRIVHDLYPTIARHLNCSTLPGQPSKQPWSLK